MHKLGSKLSAKMCLFILSISFSTFLIFLRLSIGFGFLSLLLFLFNLLDGFEECRKLFEGARLIQELSQVDVALLWLLGGLHVLWF